MKHKSVWLSDAVIQPLERSARNVLILNGVADGLCGLRRSKEEQGRREKRRGESRMLPEAGETAGEGSPQESAGVPANTRERARKKANRERLTFIYWWPGAESNCRHADFQSAALPTELPGRAPVAVCERDEGGIIAKSPWLGTEICCARWLKRLGLLTALAPGDIYGPLSAGREFFPKRLS